MPKLLYTSILSGLFSCFERKVPCVSLERIVQGTLTIVGTRNDYKWYERKGIFKWVCDWPSNWFAWLRLKNNWEEYWPVLKFDLTLRSDCVVALDSDDPSLLISSKYSWQRKRHQTELFSCRICESKLEYLGNWKGGNTRFLQLARFFPYLSDQSIGSGSPRSASLP